MKKIPNATDVHVGRRLRAMRLAREMTQSRLAEHLGITFQQVQKYENGSNRVSASRMQAMAELFNVAPGMFFEGLPLEGGGATPETLDMTAFMARQDGVEIARLWPGVVAAGSASTVLAVIRMAAGAQAAP